MTEPARLSPASPGNSTLSYSPRLRQAFNWAALTVALLPIPVALLQLLPAYRIHRLFLVFYAPLICLFTLAYLFYIRDALARAMFKHLLKPLPRGTDYYPERTSLRLRRAWASVRNGILALLPGLLMLASFVCVMRYTALLDQSATLASGALAHRLAEAEDVGMLAAPARPPVKRGEREARVAVGTPAPAAERSSAYEAALRQRALETAETDDIPYFTELTVLYIGSFLAALVAFVLMGLKEYAKEALGLSERDVVLGRILVEPE